MNNEKIKARWQQQFNRAHEKRLADAAKRQQELQRERRPTTTGRITGGMKNG